MSKIVLWVSDLAAQVRFYRELLDGEVRNESAEFAEVYSEYNSVLLHLLPADYRIETPLTKQAPAQTEVAIKPLFEAWIDVAAARDPPQAVRWQLLLTKPPPMASSTIKMSLTLRAT
jgi:catechol 2,3-dioxygenase-like lactoylglutathione lyase family enzyme